MELSKEISTPGFAALERSTRLFCILRGHFGALSFFVRLTHAKINHGGLKGVYVQSRGYLQRLTPAQAIRVLAQKKSLDGTFVLVGRY
jgi:hypothetical protein